MSGVGSSASSDAALVRERIAEVATSQPGVLFATLYGSRADDRARSDSDWDVGRALARGGQAHGRGFVTRSELEHLIRSAADIANDDEIVVIGSQAILGQFPEAPAPVAGREKDVAFVQDVIRLDLIEARVLRDRLAATSLDPERRARVAALFDRELRSR